MSVMLFKCNITHSGVSYVPQDRLLTLPLKHCDREAVVSELSGPFSDSAFEPRFNLHCGAAETMPSYS